MLEGDIICLTETWLNNSITPAKLKLNGFRLHHHPRSSSYDDTTDCQNKNVNILKLGVLNIEHIALNILDKNINVIVIYRSPVYRLDLFLPMLERLLVELQESGSDYVIMGDFNQNILEGHLSTLNCFQKFGFQQLVQHYTTEDCDYKYTNATYVYNVRGYLGPKSKQSECNEFCKKDTRCSASVVLFGRCIFYPSPLIAMFLNKDLNQCITNCSETNECLMLNYYKGHVGETCVLYSITLDELSDGDTMKHPRAIVVEKICN
ncbi:hypothetical protein LOTGIDRAFT_175888 [Lottia gigantea]|uniref:Apple domain-containing protein n=1 Tax=Lottia gigantea TaxID=225164 RepID=V3ZBJ5_LOTGI|nr:hypothetical protein LOTGIDRAFT_175888 [Lottia gigantea]ESO88383.1 hypothetical protein LOTGIDRAFT_175888 [Lottia gigantea]